MIVLSPQVFLYPFGCIPPGGLATRLGLAHIPSAAFGDGSHPTTRICAGAVDLLCRTQTIAAFLDVGTGTGVLARIARARGVKRVVATDIDPLALGAARQNSNLDLANSPIQFESSPPDHWGPCFDLVAANILEGPLRMLAPALVDSLAPAGQLILSGFTRRQSPGLRVLYQSLGLNILSETEHDGWVLLHMQGPLGQAGLAGSS